MKDDDSIVTMYPCRNQCGWLGAGESTRALHEEHCTVIKAPSIFEILNNQPESLKKIVSCIVTADNYQREKLFREWPELARGLAELIESCTEYDAPKLWWS